MSSHPFTERASGVLLHPTSLPGSLGVGDIGPGSLRFVEVLAAAGQTWWQMLPVGPPGAGSSPYDSESSFAGSPLLVSPEWLVEDGLLERHELKGRRSLAGSRASYREAAKLREALLRRAFERWQIRRRHSLDQLDAFRERSKDWLPDYALFRSLRRVHQHAPWTEWPIALRLRRPEALLKARNDLADEIVYEEFVQLQFFRQWSALRAVCQRHGIKLLGDVPMFVAHDSAEVWSNPDLFHLDKMGHRTVVAGVPPDMFSKTGQLWGNPLYQWEALTGTGYAWWIARLRALLARFDAVRLDHFIGFHRCWAIPARARTAVRGRFVIVPGADFLSKLAQSLGGLPLVAEDLGLVTPEVHALRDQFNLPGMRVLQFGFGDGADSRTHQPHRYPVNSVVYTGTHDNDTVVGWYRERAPRGDGAKAAELRRRRERIKAYVGQGGDEVHWDLIRLVLMSAANTAIIPLQDLLGLGTVARMNTPGTATGNWVWRVLDDQLTPALIERLGLLSETYERSSRSASSPTVDSALTHDVARAELQLPIA